ncbi:hypothetical protein K438DRAFT_1920852 [Mycena galopus ATCC 62051]|nr:hypothetical protein K438DRAFT_1911403 [Mycena galopus ATCC 62051]KAF8174050.1 hypothetical protein K438DRAFT_1920852 [Mycena galopus ATCC 62051]
MSYTPNIPPNPGKVVRSYTRKPALDPNPTIRPPPADAALYRPALPDFPHQQPRLRAAPETQEQKLANKFSAVEQLLENSAFDSIGDLLAILFYNRPHGESDPRGFTHATSVAHFLRGRTAIKMSDVLPLMYSHRCSFPAKDSPHLHERKSMFSTTDEAADIRHARPFMSTWATRLVAFEARKQVGRATVDDPEDPKFRVQLRAGSNGRGNSAAHVVTWRDFRNFSIDALAKRFWLKLSLPMFLTKYMSAPKVKGVFIERRRRPYPMIQVVALSSFILGRNPYATGHMALLLGIWHFVCKSHVDLKRAYSRFGNIVADTTARTALKSITAADGEEMRAETADANSRGETEHCLLLDNVQEYDTVYEQGMGRVSTLKVGTAGTKVKLQPCAPGAFSAQDYYTRVARMERKTMTVKSLFDDIDWDHEFRVKCLHWTRILADFIPQLSPLRKQIIDSFRRAPIAKRRMPEDQAPTQFQPLMLNSERETESQGMMRAVEDFDKQIGVDIDQNPNLLSWIRGDGASYAQILRLSRYTAPVGNFRNKITTPEIWHTGATDLNSIAENHYGPATSSDPSSLSKATSCAGLKRPSNLKSCDYYPTVRNLTIFWTAHVLDCWRVFYGADDLLKHFEELEKSGRLPDLETLLEEATTLVDRYASQAALQDSLHAADVNSNTNRVPAGSPWVERGSSGSSTDSGVADKTPCIHKEHTGFAGDRVLRNSQIFMLDFSWWIEMAWAVPEGDIGRVWEIFKIWIFKFAGSSHQNYMKYLLELYCFLRYESSKGLHDAVLDNYLVRVKAELGKYKPADLHQEHYNRWLQDMSRRHGGQFDEPFFRQTISPNVEHFLRLKEEIESAFNLQRRSKTHTSPHQRPELTLLLTMFKEEEVHLFREGRSMGHAAVNQFSRGCRQLEEGKMADFISTTTVLGDFFSAINHHIADSSPNPGPGESREVSDPPSTSKSNSEDDTNSMRSDSPTPSSSSSENSSSSTSGSTTSTASLESPDNDGIDMSDAPRSSGSLTAMYMDEENGLQHDEDESEEDQNEEDTEKDVELGVAEEVEEDQEDEVNVDVDCGEDEL